MTNIQITQELVKSLFDYKDGFLYWKVRKSKNINIGDRAAYVRVMKSGTRNVVTIFSKPYYCHRIIFLFHHGYLPQFVDHINRNELDDRIENLRAATKNENCRNSTSAKGSTSQYLGVHYNKTRNKWCAEIRVNYKGIHIGYFKLEHLAALAYNKAAVKHHKEFANLNIVKSLH